MYDVYMINHDNQHVSFIFIDLQSTCSAILVSTNSWAFEADCLEKPITKGPVKPKRSNHYQMSQRPETAFVGADGAGTAAHVSTSGLDHRFHSSL